MLDTLVTSKTRIKLLLKFFLNANNTAHLRGLASELEESSNAVRLELNRLQEAGMIQAQVQGNRKIYQVNTKHPLYNEINSIVFKFMGLDVLVEKVVNKLGDLQAVYLTGAIANGLDTSIIDLIFVGDALQKTYLVQLIEKAEYYIKRKVRYVVYTHDEWLIQEMNIQPLVLLWNNTKLD